MVRKTFDLSGGSVFYGLQDKTVQSIMGAQEKRRERGVVCCIEDAGKEVSDDFISLRYATSACGCEFFGN